MSLGKNSELNQILQKISVRIAELVVSGKSEGLLAAVEENYIRDHIDTVDETEYGISRNVWHREFVTKESWGDAARIITWRIREGEQYGRASELLTRSHLPDEVPRRLLDGFVYGIAYKFLETEDQIVRQDFLDSSISLLQKHLSEESLSHSSEVRLVGITAPQTAAKFSVDGTEVYLRRVIVDDLANEERYFGFYSRPRFPTDPSAILRISTLARFGGEVQRKVMQAITILRLFKVGSVNHLSYSMKTDSLLIDGETVTSGAPLGGCTRSVIADTDVRHLEEFWREMVRVLPAEGYEHKPAQVEPIEIAYKQYSDSLLAPGAVVERRISDAVMGLESLFLTRDENQELIYRLRMRVAKVLGLLGRDPYSMKKVANDAYTVRSAFVHGDRVKEDKQEEIEKRHGGLAKLLEAVLDQLRVGIITLALTRTSKEKLIKLIDDSFIDHKRLPDLENTLLPIKTLII